MTKREDKYRNLSDEFDALLTKLQKPNPEIAQKSKAFSDGEFIKER